MKVSRSGLYVVLSKDNLQRIVIALSFLVINIIHFVLLDRLMMAAVQRRTGPYNVGYFGLLQPMDDGLKLVKNEVHQCRCTIVNNFYLGPRFATNEAH